MSNVSRPSIAEILTAARLPIPKYRTREDLIIVAAITELETLRASEARLVEALMGAGRIDEGFSRYQIRGKKGVWHLHDCIGRPGCTRPCIKARALLAEYAPLSGKDGE